MLCRQKFAAGYGFADETESIPLGQLSRGGLGKSSLYYCFANGKKAVALAVPQRVRAWIEEYAIAPIPAIEDHMSASRGFAESGFVIRHKFLDAFAR